QDPTTRGTESQYLQAAAAQAPLARQFGLEAQQVQQLVTLEGQLARLHGVALPQASQILEQTLRGNTEAARSLDVVLTDSRGIVRGTGLTWQELVQAMGPTAAAAKLLSSVQVEVDRQLSASRTNADGLADSFDKLGKRADDVKTHLAKLAEKPVQVTVEVAVASSDKPGQKVDDFIRARPRAVTAPPPPPVPTPGQKALTTFRLPPAATAGLPALPEPVLPPSEQGVTAQLNSQFRR